MKCVRETFILKELCLLRCNHNERGLNHRDLPDQTSAQQLLSWQHTVSWGGSDFGPVDSDQTLLYHWFKKKSLVYANVRVLQANHKSALNLWAQSETLLVALSLTLLTESSASPKAGCHYLDQTSTCKFAHLNQILSRGTNVWTNQDSE